MGQIVKTTVIRVNMETQVASTILRQDTTTQLLVGLQQETPCLGALVILRVKTDIDSQKTKPELKQRLNLFAGIFISFAYTFLMNPMGFLISTFLLLISLMYLMGQRNFKSILPLAAGFTVLIYYVFAKILQIPLPKGLLFH